MTTSHIQEQPTTPGPSAASADHAWMRWMPVWHGIFYISLVSVIVVSLVEGSHSWEQYAAILGLSLLLAIWYGFYVAVHLSHWRRHSLITMGYLVIGWGIWFGLTLLDPLYLFILIGLYPQAYILPLMPWKIIDALILTLLCLWRQAMLVGGLDWSLLLTLGSGAFGILLALFIHAIAQQSQERYQLISELEATRHELAAAERQAGIMEERQRLAREIHDTLAQGFTSIVMHIEAAEGALPVDLATVQRHLDQVRRTARENLAEARRLMWALQPEALDRASLPEVLTNLAGSWSEESGVAASASITGTSRSLRPEIEVTLLRAAQEALVNARKYARASQVALTLSYMDDVVVLDVQDDGVGFDSSQMCVSPSGQTSGGFGLKALRERVEQLGGTLSIESAAGEGTTIAVALPAFGNELLMSTGATKAKEVR